MCFFFSSQTSTPLKSCISLTQRRYHRRTGKIGHFVCCKIFKDRRYSRQSKSYDHYAAYLIQNGLRWLFLHSKRSPPASLGGLYGMCWCDSSTTCWHKDVLCRPHLIRRAPLKAKEPSALSRLPWISTTRIDESRLKRNQQIKTSHSKSGCGCLWRCWQASRSKRFTCAARWRRLHIAFVCMPAIPDIRLTYGRVSPGAS